MLGQLVGGFVVILIGVQLLPIVATSVAAAQANITDSSVDTLVGLTTVFYALGVMSAGVSLAVGGLRSAGLV